MTKRYLRFNRNRQKSTDEDEIAINIERNIPNQESEAWATRYPTRNNIKSNSNKDIYGPVDPQELPESFRNMKRIWKKAVFSIKKETKNKPGGEYTKSEIEMPTPSGDISKAKSSPGNLDVDPIYLMLRSAAYKANDGSELGPDDDRNHQIEDERNEKDIPHRDSSNNLAINYPDQKLSPNEELKKIPDSVSGKSVPRRRLDARMKSLSVDNPEVEIHEENEDIDDSIYHQSRQFSNSFTNTNAIESNPYSMRRKYLKEQHRSISMENEHHPIVTSSCENYRSNSSIKSNDVISPRQSSRYINVISDESKRNSQSSVSKSNLRTTRTNWKMKSFSVDVPDGDVDISASSSQYILKGGNSHTSSPIRERSNYYKSSDSPGYDNRSSHSNLHSAKRAPRPNFHNPISPESLISSHHARHNPCRYDPEFDNNPIDHKRLSTNSYVVLYDFYARRSDELDLKAGWKVNVLNSSDPDWWTGRCNGRIGYFPAAYVQKIHYGDSVWKIVRDISLNDDDGNTFKLRKGEIVVQQGSQDSESIPICIKRISYLWCPIDYVGKIFDDYI